MRVKVKAQGAGELVQLAQLPVDVAALVLEPGLRVEEPGEQGVAARGVGVEDLGEQHLDHLAAEPGGQQLLDGQDPVDVAWLEDPVPGRAAARPEQSLLLVVAHRARAHPGALRELADLHGSADVAAQRGEAPDRRQHADVGEHHDQGGRTGEQVG